MAHRLLALLRHAAVVVGILLGSAGILWMRGRPTLLAKALDELSPAEQQVIYLRFAADLTTGEIAQVMGSTEQDVRLLQLRAIRTLVRFMASH